MYGWKNTLVLVLHLFLVQGPTDPPYVANNEAICCCMLSRSHVVVHSRNLLRRQLAVSSHILSASTAHKEQWRYLFTCCESITINNTSHNKGTHTHYTLYMYNDSDNMDWLLISSFFSYSAAWGTVAIVCCGTWCTQTIIPIWYMYNAQQLNTGTPSRLATVVLCVQALFFQYCGSTLWGTCTIPERVCPCVTSYIHISRAMPGNRPHPAMEKTLTVQVYITQRG